MDKHIIQGGVEILLVTSCYGNQDKLWPDWSLDSNVDFTLPYPWYNISITAHQNEGKYQFVSRVKLNHNICIHLCL